MRFAERSLAASAIVLFALSTQPDGGSLAAVSGQRYAMGTMFDVVVHHHSVDEARRAIDSALSEVVRLDRVMSHYDRASELARVQRDGRVAAVRVDPALYDVVRTAQDVSYRSRGRFDVTVAPLVKLWKDADAEGRRPDADALARVRRCVGFEKIELVPPDRIRLRSECVSIDLGGIGKGYAVDHALDVLGRAHISHAIVNAGGSSIGALGAPPARDGWPVILGGGRVLLLNGTSMSTSQQDEGAAGHVIDPISGAPVSTDLTATVVLRSATLADALSTTLLLLPVEEGRRLLASFDAAAAMWISADGGVRATFGASRLAFASPD